MNIEEEKPMGTVPTAAPTLPIELITFIGKLMEILKHELRIPNLEELEQQSGMSAGEILGKIASHG